MRAQRLTRELVAQVVHVIDDFALRVMKANLFPDRRPVDDHVHVFVQADGEDESAVLGVVRGEVRAAAAEGDAEGSPGDDHGRILIYDLEHTGDRCRADALRRQELIEAARLVLGEMPSLGDVAKRATRATCDGAKRQSVGARKKTRAGEL